MYHHLQIPRKSREAGWCSVQGYNSVAQQDGNHLIHAVWFLNFIFCYMQLFLLFKSELKICHYLLHIWCDLSKFFKSHELWFYRSCGKNILNILWSGHAQSLSYFKDLSYVFWKIVTSDFSFNFHSPMKFGWEPHAHLYLLSRSYPRHPVAYVYFKDIH